MPPKEVIKCSSTLNRSQHGKLPCSTNQRVRVQACPTASEACDMAASATTKEEEDEEAEEEEEEAE